MMMHTDFQLTVVALFCMLLIIGLSLLYMHFEYKRGVRDGQKRGKLDGFRDGRASMKDEIAQRTSKLISDAGTLAEKMGLSDEAMQDSLLLMDAAQNGIESQFLGVMRKKGEAIDAPRRTHYAGKPVTHCSNCGVVDKVRVRSTKNERNNTLHMKASCLTCDQVLHEYDVEAA